MSHRVEWFRRDPGSGTAHVRPALPPVTTPAATLRAAAERVRELAEVAVSGPWMAVQTDDLGFVLDADDAPGYDEPRRREVVAATALPLERHGSKRMPSGYEPQHKLMAAEAPDLGEDQDAELWASMCWIATMSPAIAEPLAAWLEKVADSIEICTRELAVMGVVTTDAHIKEAHPEALSIAHAILATTPSPSGSNPGGEQS